MSPEAGTVLLEQIAPRLKGMLPRIKPIGSEDAEELFQDGLALAAKMLHDLELRGKQVTPGNVAYYICLHLKSGRRSHSYGRTDVYSSATQLDGKAQVMSFETEVGYDPETMESIRLGDLLTCSTDDPSMTAGRNLDWQEFIDTHDYRYGVVIRDIIHDKTALEEAKEWGERYHQVRSLRYKLADDLQEYLGVDALADASRVPGWMAGIHAEREKTACRHH